MKAVNLWMVLQLVLMDVLVSKSHGIPEYILVLDTIHKKLSYPLHCLKLAATTIKISITTLELVFHT